MTDEVLAECKRFGFELRVYTNRIEVVEGAYRALQKTTTLLLRNIASVGMDRVKAHLTVKSNDGHTYHWTTAPHTQALHDAIVSHL